MTELAVGQHEIGLASPVMQCLTDPRLTHDGPPSLSQDGTGTLPALYRRAGMGHRVAKKEEAGDATCGEDEVPAGPSDGSSEGIEQRSARVNRRQRQVNIINDNSKTITSNPEDGKAIEQGLGHPSPAPSPSTPPGAPPPP